MKTKRLSPRELVYLWRKRAMESDYSVDDTVSDVLDGCADALEASMNQPEAGAPIWEPTPLSEIPNAPGARLAHFLHDPGTLSPRGSCPSCLGGDPCEIHDGSDGQAAEIVALRPGSGRYVSLREACEMAEMSGIYDEFSDPIDALIQMGQHIRELQEEVERLRSGINEDEPDIADLDRANFEAGLP